MRKLLDEFGQEMNRTAALVYTEPSDAIVVLSAPPLAAEGRLIEETPENVERIRYAIYSAREMAIPRSGHPIREVAPNVYDYVGAFTPKEITEHAPVLVLNGETEQLPMMESVANRYWVVQEKILSVNCGKRGVGNTLTQFTALRDDARLQSMKRFTIVTSSYHVPRVRRTARAILPPAWKVDVVGVPYDRYQFDVPTLVLGEIQRIITYAKKGDFELCIE